MRIVAGDNRGFRFSPPRNIPARPTTDIAKEALFNILNNHFYFDEVSFLDLFAGTGNISYEFFSRGCRDITSVDLSPISIKFIRSISERLKMDGHEILQEDVFRFIARAWRGYDIIFAGPPYPLEIIDDIPDMIMQSDILNKNGSKKENIAKEVADKENIVEDGNGDEEKKSVKNTKEIKQKTCF